MNITDLLTPVVILDKAKLHKNIISMARKAKESGVILRPHIKTHKCIEIAHLQRENGAEGIAVSTPYEALIFSRNGFKDITLAFPAVLDKIPTILEIHKKSSLKILVDHPKSVEQLERECRKENEVLNVLLKVDSGYHRCGVEPTRPESIKIAKYLHNSNFLNFCGILSHAGHAYSSSFKEIQEIAIKEQEIMTRFARQLRNEGVQVETVSIGSTPTVMATNEFLHEITEIRPGNYVFFDATQVRLGSCTLDKCAVSVLTSVVGVYPHHIVTDAGATTLSKDTGPTHIDPKCGYGIILSDNSYQDVPIEGAHMNALSQEHGKIYFDKSTKAQNFKPGDRLRIVPNHSCLVANLTNHYFVVEDREIVAEWQILNNRLNKSL